jgi:hypothetical protein
MFRGPSYSYTESVHNIVNVARLAPLCREKSVTFLAADHPPARMVATGLAERGAREPGLLAGLLFDGTGERLSPSKRAALSLLRLAGADQRSTKQPWPGLAVAGA